MGTSKWLGDNLTKCWKVTCDGLVSHPGGSRNTPSCFILQKLELSAGTDELSLNGMYHYCTKEVLSDLQAVKTNTKC